MKRAGLLLGLAAFVTTPAAAQWLGTPIWNPKGGTGLTIYGDYGKPNTDAGGGYAFGARAALGLSTLTLTAGLTSYEPEGLDAHATSYGGTAAFRLIGGSLLPVAVNLQVGAAHNGEVTPTTGTPVPAQTTVIGAVGVSVPLPTPGFTIEPYFSPGIRYHHFSNVTAPAPDHETNFGWVIGGNLGFGLVGVHLAYDSEKFDDGTTHGVFGVGANVGFRLPMGF